MTLTPEVIAQLLGSPITLADIDKHLLINGLDDVHHETITATVAADGLDLNAVDNACDELQRIIMRNQPDFSPMARKLVDEFAMADTATDRQLALLMLGYLAELAVKVKAVG